MNEPKTKNHNNDIKHEINNNLYGAIHAKKVPKQSNYNDLVTCKAWLCNQFR